MNKLVVLVLLLTSATLIGCQGACGSKCGSFQANCCGWEFYKPCDLIEGKRADCDLSPCEVVIIEDAKTPAPEAAPAPKAAPAPEGVDEAPAAAPLSDAGFPAPRAPISDYGTPPTGR